MIYLSLKISWLISHLKTWGLWNACAALQQRRFIALGDPKMTCVSAEGETDLSFELRVSLCCIEFSTLGVLLQRHLGSYYRP